MFYDLNTNSIMGGDGFFDYVARRIEPGEMQELELIYDFLKLMADGSWGRFLDSWDFDAGDRHDALYSYLRNIRNARIANSVLHPSRIARR